MEVARRTLIFLIPAIFMALGGARARMWKEPDFTPRPVVAYTFSLGKNGSDLTTVVGMPHPFAVEKGDTLYDIARHVGLGINEMEDALPNVDKWLPPEGETLRLPTWWVLPESDHQGIVVNIPEMRLYYFPAPRGGPPTVVTYAVGLGRDEWQTPTGRFKVAEKTVNPTWVIPESIREERIREKGLHDKLIRGGEPDNPLGRYRMRLTLPLYGIHGTNIAWGVGMQVSHGCVRLYPEDIERLFPIVPVGTPGEFVYQPIKIGTRQGRIYMEVHRDIYDNGFDYWNEASALLRDKGWENHVDWGKVAAAIEQKSGVPTRITHGAPLLEQRAPEPEVSEARARSGRKPALVRK